MVAGVAAFSERIAIIFFGVVLLGVGVYKELTHGPGPSAEEG